MTEFAAPRFRSLAVPRPTPTPRADASAPANFFFAGSRVRRARPALFRPGKETDGYNIRLSAYNRRNYK